MIVRLQHIGLAVESLETFSETFDRLFDMRPTELRTNQGGGHQLDARIMFPNRCWFHVVQNWNPASRVNKFLQAHGEGLEHLALETDDIEADVAHLREIGVPVYQDKIFNAPDGFEAFVYPDDAIGFTVELIQPHETSWNFDPAMVTNPNIVGIQHIGIGVRDVVRAAERFEQLFGLKATELRTDQHYGDQRDMRINLGNDWMWLEAMEPKVKDHRVSRFMARHGEGIEHVSIEVADIRKAVWRVRAAGAPFDEHKIFLDRDDGMEVFVLPEHAHGFTVEFIEPYPSSRGYRRKEA